MKNTKNKNMKNIFMNVLITGVVTLAMIVATVNVAYAWINGVGSPSTDPNEPVIGTHDRLLESAVSMLPTDMRDKINITAADYGTEMPDYNNTMCNCSYGIRDQKYHQVYYRANGSLQDNSSARRAQEEYNLAMKNLSIGDEYNFSIHVGMMSHYIVEVGNFAHTMGNNSEWGGEGSHTHSDYENYVAGNYTLFFNRKYMKFDGVYENTSAHNATLALANDTTFDNKFGNGTHTNVWMNNMINDSANASYTFANDEFVDRTRQSINYSTNLLADVIHLMFLTNATTDPVITPNVTATPTPVPTKSPSSGSTGSSGSSGSSSGSSSGGGGGGGLGSAEPYSNILKYEIQEHAIFTTPVSFKYVTPELSVYDVIVTSNQSNVASLRIEALKGVSKLAGSDIEGAVYKNFNAWINYKRIKNATLKFKVENTWMDDNGLSSDIGSSDVGDVKLSKWDNVSKKWIELDTSVTGKDGTYTYFESVDDLRNGGNVLSGSYLIGSITESTEKGDNVEIGDNTESEEKGDASLDRIGDNTGGDIVETEDNVEIPKVPGFGMLATIMSIFLMVYVLRKR